METITSLRAGNKIFCPSGTGQHPAHPPYIIGLRYKIETVTINIPQIIASEQIGKYNVVYEQRCALRIYCKQQSNSTYSGDGTRENPCTNFEEAVKFMECISYRSCFDFYQILLLPESEPIVIPWIRNEKILIGDLDSSTKTKATLEYETRGYTFLGANLDISLNRAASFYGDMIKCKFSIRHNQYDLDFDRTGNSFWCDFIFEDTTVLRGDVFYGCFVQNARMTRPVYDENDIIIVNSVLEKAEILQYNGNSIAILSESTINSGVTIYVKSIYNSNVSMNDGIVYISQSISNSVISRTFESSGGDYLLPVVASNQSATSGPIAISNSTIKCDFTRNLHNYGSYRVGTCGIVMYADNPAQCHISNVNFDLDVRLNPTTGGPTWGYKFTCNIAHVKTDGVHVQQSKCVNGCSYSRFGSPAREEDWFDFSCENMVTW